MIGTNKYYQPFSFSEDDRKKLLFQELLSATIICFATLVVTLLINIEKTLVIAIDFAGVISFLISLFLVHKHYKAAIMLYLTSSIILVFLIIFFFPAIKFAALFILIISLNGFIYLKNYKLSKLFLISSPKYQTPL